MSGWLITGGAGFIGANFVRMAAERVEDELVVIDALTYAGNLANIVDLVDSGRVHFVRGDICDEDAVTGIFREYEIDRVFHFAAESHVDRSILGPSAFLRTNIEGTYTLLEVSRRTWTRNDGDNLFMHVSTDEVFGSLNKEEPAFTEVSQYRPNSPYSASKAAADHLVRAWRKTYDLPVIITNCSNNYGPWQFPEKLLPLMILNALEGRELPVYGDGLQVRDWLHVEDHCEALLAVMQRGIIGETYVIGGNNEWPNIDLVRLICKTVDELTGNPPGTSEKLVRSVKDRPGHDRRYALDATKLGREVGWESKRHFAQGVRDVVQWYLDHQQWAAEIRSGEYLKYYERQYGDR